MAWLQNLMAKMIGKKIAKDLDLKEGVTMEEKKQWWKSQTIWSDILTIGMGVWAVATPVLATHGVNLPAIPGWLLTLLGAAGIHGRVTATTTIGS